MELEVEATEHRVGSFLADILARVVEETGRHHCLRPIFIGQRRAIKNTPKFGPVGGRKPGGCNFLDVLAIIR
jgi:hypothetical protein